MNENICLANFGDKLKVNGKVDLQYVMEDGSVIHNKAKNTAFLPTWAASGLIKYLLTDANYIKIELTDGDYEPDPKFPFLRGEPVGYSYLNAAASGIFRGQEVSNKRVVVADGDTLTVSFTYEWNASQIPGPIRTIGYTLQDNTGISNKMRECSTLTVPIINATNQTTPSRVLSASGYYSTVYDYFREVSYSLYTRGYSQESTSNGYTLQLTVYKAHNTYPTSYSSKAIKLQLTDFSVYTYGYGEVYPLYNADTGEYCIIVGYMIKQTSASTSKYEVHRAMFSVDFESGTSTKKWDVLLSSYDSNYQYDRINPYYPNATFRPVLVQRNNKIYTKLDGFSLTNLKNEIASNERFSSTFIYFDSDKLSENITKDDIGYCNRFTPSVYDDNTIRDLNYCYAASGSLFAFIITRNMDVGYISDYDYVITTASNSTSSSVSAIIEPDTNQLIIRPSYYNGAEGALGDGPIGHTLIGDDKVYFIQKYYNYSSSESAAINKLKMVMGCADAEMFQALTQFHVPAEAQVRPENSGVRIVYELTISNPT